MPSLSPYIFIICVEVLANAIRNKKNIQGIKVNGTECKISQYADDTVLLLDGSKHSLQASLETLDIFNKISGLKMNIIKTEALWIGSLSGSTNIFFPERKLKWANHIVKTLGVYFSTNEALGMKKNIQEKIDKIKKLTKTGI